MHPEYKLYPSPSDPKAQTCFSRQGGNLTYPGALFPIGTPTAENAKSSDPAALLRVQLSSASLGTAQAASRISHREFVVSDPKALALLPIVWAGRGQIGSERVEEEEMGKGGYRE